MYKILPKSIFRYLILAIFIILFITRISANANKNNTSSTAILNNLEALLEIQETELSQFDLGRKNYILQQDLTFEDWISISIDAFNRYVPEDAEIPTDHRYLTLFAAFGSRWRESPQDVALAWKKFLFDVEKPDNWRAFILKIGTQATIAISNGNLKLKNRSIAKDLTPERVMRDLLKILDSDQTQSIQTAALRSIQELNTKSKEALNAKLRSDSVAESIRLLERQCAQLRDGGQNEKNYLAIIDEGFLTLYKCFLSNAVASSSFHKRILRFQDDLSSFDASCCISYIRLLKYGLDVQPGGNVIEISNDKVHTSRDRRVLKSLLNRPKLD